MGQPGVLQAEDVEAVVASIRPLVEGDGARLDVLDVEPGTGTIRLGLRVDDVSCAECLMPAETLTDIMEEHFRRVLPAFRQLDLHDPREAAW